MHQNTGPWDLAGEASGEMADLAEGLRRMEGQSALPQQPYLIDRGWGSTERLCYVCQGEGCTEQAQMPGSRDVPPTCAATVLL